MKESNSDERDAGDAIVEFSYIREIRKVRDASPAERDVLARFVAALIAEEPVDLGRVNELAATNGVDHDLLRRAVHLYARNGGGYRATGRGRGFVIATGTPQAPVRGQRDRGAHIQVQVLPHAVDRAIQRRLVASREFHVARAEIVEEVRAGIVAGRRSTDRPRWVRLSSKANPRIWYSAKQHYVWDEAKTRAWVVLIEGNEVVVRTGLGAATSSQPR
jgi:hypothetical protein